MRKIQNIIWKDVYIIFTDRSLIIILIITPLIISSIVALVFSGFGDGGISFSDIPVAIVNLDRGAEQQGQSFFYGQGMVDLFVPSDDNQMMVTCPLSNDTFNQADMPITLDELVNASVLNDSADARTGVDNGDYTAAIIIPSDFSSSLSSDNDEAVAIEVYGNTAQPVSSSIIYSIVDGYTNQILTGNIALDASINTLMVTNPLTLINLQNNPEAQSLFGCGFSTVLNTVNISRRPVTADDTGDAFDQILLSVGTAQTVFFAMFAASAGILSIIEERQAWTLQRLLISPTSRLEILAGKLGGTYVTVIFQVVVMLLALTFVASLAAGVPKNIWGANLPAIILVVLSIGVAVCGVGALIVGVAKTPEQANSIGTVVNIIIAMLGGAFGPSFAPPISYVSLIYWGTDALEKLSVGNTDIILNVLVLMLQGVIAFAVGFWLFNRRLDV